MIAYKSKTLFAAKFNKYKISSGVKSNKERKLLSSYPSIPTSFTSSSDFFVSSVFSASFGFDDSLYSVLEDSSLVLSGLGENVNIVHENGEVIIAGLSPVIEETVTSGLSGQEGGDKGKSTSNETKMSRDTGGDDNSKKDDKNKDNANKKGVWE